MRELAKLDRPIVVGGGVRTNEVIRDLSEAGANVIVIGNKIENDLDFLLDIRTYLSDKSQPL